MCDVIDGSLLDIWWATWAQLEKGNNLVAGSLHGSCWAMGGTHITEVHEALRLKVLAELGLGDPERFKKWHVFSGQNFLPRAIDT
jgi:hypothetical protein